VPTLPGFGRLSVLLLCEDHPTHANTIHDHIDALCGLSRHSVRRYNPAGSRGPFLDLDAFDVVVIHYSIYILGDHHLPPHVRDAVSAYTGLKVQFIQDDYRLIDQMTERMRQLGIALLFTLVPEREIDNVWTSDRLPGVSKVNSLAGYVPEELCRLGVPAYEDRPVDIGYRGREIPYWLGRLGQEKRWIGEGVLQHADDLGLVCDIAWREQDRIYGEEWIRFLTRSKATLVSESGATITDFDGSVEKRTRGYLADHPGAPFDEVFDQILAPYEGNVMMNVISPRVFEAVALRTALVMFPGEYSGVVERDRHYIPLAKDFSNLAEVARRLRDVQATKAMIQRAYDEVAMSGRYTLGAFVKQFDTLLDEHVRSLRRQPVRGRLPSLHERSARSPQPPAMTRRWRARARNGLDPVRSSAGRWRARARNSALLAGQQGRRWLLSTRGGVRRRVRQTGLTAAIVLKQLRAEPTLARLLVAMTLERSGGPSWATAFHELQLLHVLRQAARRRVSAGEPFDVSVSLDERGHLLTITSGPAGSAEREVSRTQLKHALESGAFGMVWHHRDVGTAVHQRMTDRWWVTVPVGDDGNYEFQALPRLASTSAGGLAAALAPLCEPPPSRGPVPFKLAIGSAVVLARSATEGAFRRALIRYLRRARSQADRRAVLADAVRLRAAVHAMVQPTGFAVDARHEAGCRRLTLRSRALSEGPPRLLGDRLERPPVQLFWDHTAIADHVLVPVALGKRVMLSLGAEPHRFRALEPLDLGFGLSAWTRLLPPRAENTSEAAGPVADAGAQPVQ